MSIAPHVTEADLGPLPDGLASPRSKLVYLTLTITGGATVEELQDALDVPKLTLFAVLEALAGRELVERAGDRYVVAN